MFFILSATSIGLMIGTTITFFTSAYAVPVFRLTPQQAPSVPDSNLPFPPITFDMTNATITTSNTTNTLPPIPLGNATEILNAPDLMRQLRRSAQFTNAAYCTSATVQTWTCGPTCDVLGNITVLYTGGTNQLIPDYYIAHDPSTDTVILAQQGTDPRQIQSLFVDAQIIQSPLNGTYFPTAPTNTLVHTGFQDAFLRTVEDVKREVEWAVEDFGVNKVLVTGHSLGAAIGVMNGVFLTGLFEGRGVNVTTQVFGLPRAGNSVWADFVDRTIGANFVHMHLNHDPIPTVPPLGLFDYMHPSGEVFDPFMFDPSATNGTATRDGSTAVFCPGRENENCSAGNSLISDNILDHLGPYLTVDIGSFSCPH